MKLVFYTPNIELFFLKWSLLLDEKFFCGFIELERSGLHFQFSENFYLHQGLRIQKYCFLFLVSVNDHKTVLLTHTISFIIGQYSLKIPFQ